MLRCHLRTILLACSLCIPIAVAQTHVEASSASIAYSSGWEATTHGGGQITDVQGSTATFTFTGNAISLISTKSKSHGIEQVVLDGTTYSADCTWPDRSVSGQEVVVWSRSGLSCTSHTFVFRKLSDDSHSAAFRGLTYTPCTPSVTSAAIVRPNPSQSVSTKMTRTATMTTSRRVTAPSWTQVTSTGAPDSAPQHASESTRDPVSESSGGSSSQQFTLVSSKTVGSTGTSSTSTIQTTAGTLPTANKSIISSLQTINGQVVIVVTTVENSVSGSVTAYGSQQAEGISTLTRALIGAASGLVVLLLIFGGLCLRRRRRLFVVTAHSSHQQPPNASAPHLLQSLDAGSTYSTTASQASTHDTRRLSDYPSQQEDRPPAYISMLSSAETQSTEPLFDTAYRSDEMARPSTQLAVFVEDSGKAKELLSEK